MQISATCNNLYTCLHACTAAVFACYGVVCAMDHMHECAHLCIVVCNVCKSKTSQSVAIVTVSSVTIFASFHTDLLYTRSK